MCRRRARGEKLSGSTEKNTARVREGLRSPLCWAAPTKPLTTMAVPGSRCTKSSERSCNSDPGGSARCCWNGYGSGRTTRAGTRTCVCWRDATRARV